MVFTYSLLQVPQIVSPADLNNPMIDELSVMTYISYYFGPANERLMKWLQEKLPEKKITNSPLTGMMELISRFSLTGFIPIWLPTTQNTRRKMLL